MTGGQRMFQKVLPATIKKCKKYNHITINHQYHCNNDWPKAVDDFIIILVHILIVQSLGAKYILESTSSNKKKTQKILFTQMML